MTTDWRALCVEPLAQEAYVAFVQICKGGSDDAGTYDADEATVRRALKRLNELEDAAVAEPEGPTDEELRELWQNSWDTSEEHGAFQFARAVLARWGHQPAPLAEGEQRHPEPVPVGERLPGPKDCDAEGRCWAWDWLAEKWCLCDRTSACHGFDHWLPAHALPLPAGEVEPNAE